MKAWLSQIAFASAPKDSRFGSALKLIKPALMHALIFGFFTNLLALVGPLYMMQIYDRVLASRNLSTLLGLTIIVAVFYGVLAALEAVRSRVLVRAGVRFDNAISGDVFDAVQKTNVHSSASRNTQALRDIDTVREFSTGSGIIAFCDVPWIPIYIIACFLLHPSFGVFAILGGFVVLVLALVNERLSKPLIDKASQSAMSAHGHAATALRNTEVIQAMGMLEALKSIWAKRHEQVLGWQAAASNKAGPLIALSKFMRMLLQSLTLGLGAYLAIRGSITPGTMIAASIIVGRVLSPVDQLIGQWKSFVSCRAAHYRLSKLFESLPAAEKKMPLPAPMGNVEVDHVSARVPGTDRIILSNVCAKIAQGTIVGVVGPSGAGKSTLVRAIAGAWPIAAGHVRFDGADAQHWDSGQLGKHLGYLPQDVELFPGTVAQNICRFNADATEDLVISAAELAGVHDMIQELAQGYNTQLGENGLALSGGQRQRIGLARAVYGKPPIVILDEPNSNLDFAGDNALIDALTKMRAARMTVIFVTHKINMLAQADKILLLKNGQVQAFGEREEVLAAISKANVEKHTPNVHAVSAVRSG